MATPFPITGRCYCGACTVSSPVLPQTVTYCHCASCRRLSGAPVAAFAAFNSDEITIKPTWPEVHSSTPGVERWFCKQCGTALAAQYDYLPDQIYVPLGLLDQADALPPEMHSYADKALSWLHIADDLPRNDASSRDDLKAAGDYGHKK